ncbi:hypothetical protein OEZ85_013655 [Tetradesmus obliquus]|uniref:SBP-type domain-containing protein n=1 Tax=Tetradesmus obliquus TaxID=3088 RepID=A0ABY8UR03_TETOB|nr:hypothetical protein OEZ85_013655 [Tetradesmus obliquus]
MLSAADCPYSSADSSTFRGMSRSMGDIDDQAGTPDAADEEQQYQAGTVQDKQATNRRRSKSGLCQVQGCGTHLKRLRKTYCTRLGICPACMKASSVRLPGDNSEPMRFCFQCGKVQPLTMFEGNKRSCMASLQKRHVAPESNDAGPPLHSSSKRRTCRGSHSGSTGEAGASQQLPASDGNAAQQAGSRHSPAGWPAEAAGSWAAMQPGLQDWQQQQQQQQLGSQDSQLQQQQLGLQDSQLQQQQLGLQGSQQQQQQQQQRQQRQQLLPEDVLCA